MSQMMQWAPDEASERAGEDEPDERKSGWVKVPTSAHLHAGTCMVPCTIAATMNKENNMRKEDMTAMEGNTVHCR